MFLLRLTCLNRWTIQQGMLLPRRFMQKTEKKTGVHGV